jgi:murein tripeptide amidase MpaA
MLNPDGVSHGHYRMDIYNQNLNRFYLNPDNSKQPSAYAMRRLGQYFSL